MKILRVVGLALLIITLKFLVPRVFHGAENTLVVFFDTLEALLTKSKSLTEAGALISLPR